MPGDRLLCGLLFQQIRAAGNSIAADQYRLFCVCIRSDDPQKQGFAVFEFPGKKGEGRAAIIPEEQSRMICREAARTQIGGFDASRWFVLRCGEWKLVQNVVPFVALSRCSRATRPSLTRRERVSVHRLWDFRARQSERMVEFSRYFRMADRLSFESF